MPLQNPCSEKGQIPLGRVSICYLMYCLLASRTAPRWYVFIVDGLNLRELGSIGLTLITYYVCTCTLVATGKARSPIRRWAPDTGLNIENTPPPLHAPQLLTTQCRLVLVQKTRKAASSGLYSALIGPEPRGGLYWITSMAEVGCWDLSDLFDPFFVFEGGGGWGVYIGIANTAEVRDESIKSVKSVKSVDCI